MFENLVGFSYWFYVLLLFFSFCCRCCSATLFCRSTTVFVSTQKKNRKTSSVWHSAEIVLCLRKYTEFVMIYLFIADCGVFIHSLLAYIFCGPIQRWTNAHIHAQAICMRRTRNRQKAICTNSVRSAIHFARKFRMVKKGKKNHKKINPFSGWKQQF